MRKSLIIGLATTVLAAGSIGVIASERYERGGHHINRMTEELDLSKAQEEALTEQMKNKRDSMRSSKEKRHDIRTALIQLNPQEKGYQAKLDKLTKEAALLASEMVKQQAEQQKTLFSILTPKQREELAELKSERKDRMEKHKERHNKKQEHGKHCR